MVASRVTRPAWPLILLAITLGGCTARQTPEYLPSETEGTVITAEDIARIGGDNAWAVLQRAGTHLSMRDDGYGNPAALSQRGYPSIELSNAPILYVDGVRISDFRRLEEITARSIERIQILTGTQATRYYGTGAGNGVIAIRTRA